MPPISRPGPLHPLPALLLASGLMLLTGCGGHDASISGLVTLDGKPIANGTVTFHPVGDGAAAYGRIADDGTYSISTGSEKGLAPGDYVVTVMATEATEPTEPGVAPPIPKPITPPRYAQVEQSDLRFTVNSGNNQIDLELKQ